MSFYRLPTEDLGPIKVFSDKEAFEHLGLLVQNCRSCGWTLTNLAPVKVVVVGREAPIAVARVLHAGDLIEHGNQLFRFYPGQGST